MKKYIILLIMGIVVCNLGSVQAVIYDVVEFPVYTGSGDQSHPVIDGDIVVWIDNAGFGSSEGFIHYKNLSLGQDNIIVTSQTSDAPGWTPAIDGDNIVWSDTRSGESGNYGFYGYNVSTQTEFLIWEDGRQRVGIDVYGDLVYGVEWKGSDDYDIYEYNISEGTRNPISTASYYQYFPVTNGETVIWQDMRNNDDNWDIYGYDLSTQTEFSICTAIDHQEAVEISNNILVWEDYRSRSITLSDIYGYDLDTQTEFAICTNNAKQEQASISDNFVVWQDDRNGDWDIFGLDLSTMTEFTIASGLGDQMYPSISGNTVVWESGGDIYGAEIVPEPCSLLILSLGGLLVRKRQ